MRRSITATGCNRIARSRPRRYRVKYAVIILYIALWKRAVILLTNVGQATCPHDLTRNTLLPLLLSLSFFFLAPNCHPLLLHIRRGWEKRRKKMGNRDEIETSGSSRVYSSCTRIWLHERVYAQRVSIRGFTGSKVPSGSIIIPLCCLSLALGEGGANVVLERRWNGATLWLTVPSGNGQRRGGTATRRPTCVSIAIYQRTPLKFRLIARRRSKKSSTRRKQVGSESFPTNIVRGNIILDTLLPILWTDRVNYYGWNKVFNETIPSKRPTFIDGIKFSTK